MLPESLKFSAAPLRLAQITKYSESVPDNFPLNKSKIVNEGTAVKQANGPIIRIIPPQSWHEGRYLASIDQQENICSFMRKRFTMEMRLLILELFVF